MYSKMDKIKIYLKAITDYNGLVWRALLSSMTQQALNTNKQTKKQGNSPKVLRITLCVRMSLCFQPSL